MDVEFLERALVWFERSECRGVLGEAQAAFMSATGAFEAGEPWWEERIRAFHDWFLFGYELPGGRVALARFMDEAGDSLREAERDVYRELLAVAHRSLFEVERLRGADVDLADRIGRVRYRVTLESHAAGWERGDLIDAWILRSGGTLTLSRGVLFHPRPAREAIGLLVEYARSRAGAAPWDIVDLFARMKLAYERSETPRVPAIYTPESYLYRDYVAQRGRARGFPPSTGSGPAS